MASIPDTLAAAARWSAEPDPIGFNTGFHDRIQVAVAHDFAERLGVTSEADKARLELTIRDTFRAWENDALRFDIDFERTPVQGIAPGQGFEIDLFAVPQSHPVFAGSNYFGYTLIDWVPATARLLANGDRSDGLVIVGVDIYINVDTVLTLGSLIPPERRPDALQRLMMHELGHGLGFAHPNSTSGEGNAFYDTDMDAKNLMVIDPAHPFDDLILSSVNNPQAIMSNDRTRPGPFLYFTSVQADDRGGRDVLYATYESCVADCNGDGEVDIAEVVTAVTIAQEEQAVGVCLKADANRDAAVSIEELLRSVDKALNGCGPTPRSQRDHAVARATGALRTTAIGCGFTPEE